ncbi:MAG: hypothetical protein KAS23_14605 [Anaerohalosphaera sp.]|nr:hypothetical protein [Anaerohalosphaera sp.]
MTDEHIFIQDLLKQHNVSVSQLAQSADMADSTVYEYTGGRKKYVPLAIYRALYALTEDPRVLDLVIGDVESFVIPMPKKGADNSSEATMKRLIEKRKKDIECEIAILNILADGRIDEEDKDAIAEYKQAHPESIKLSAQVYHNIMYQYEKATNK